MLSLMRMCFLSSLHKNAGARLRHEISLLPEHLLSSYPGGVGSFDRYSNTDPNEHTSIVVNEQEAAGDEYECAEEIQVQNEAPSGTQEAQGVQTLGDTLGTKAQADSVGAVVKVDTILLGSGVDPPETATVAVLRNADSSPGRSRLSGVRGVTGQGVPVVSLSGSDGGGSSRGVLGSNAPVTTDEPEMQRARTRSQSGIFKPKVYTNGTVHYANFNSTGEPTSLDEALSDPNWKKAMQEEIKALHKNNT